MPRALRVCPCVGCGAHEGACPEVTPGGKCDGCKRAAEKRRAGHRERGGGNNPAWRRTRAAVLIRDPECVCTDTTHGHADLCGEPSTVADHHPLTKRQLIDMGVPDPDALHRLRGICAPCHNKHTAAESPGGWAAR